MRNLIAFIALLFIATLARADYQWFSDADNFRAGSAEAICEHNRAIYAANYKVTAIDYNANFTQAHCSTSGPYASSGYDAGYAVLVTGSNGCTAPQVVGSHNDCVTPPCPYGQSNNGPNGACQKVCPTNQHLEPTSYNGGPIINQCVADPQCPVGQVTSSGGSCQNIQCPTGQVLLAGACILPPTEQNCAAGTHRNVAGGACLPDNPPPLDPCPAGTHNIGADASQPNCASGAAAPSSSPYVKNSSKSNPDGSTTQTTMTTSVVNNADNTQTTTTITNTTNISAGGSAAPTVTSSDSSTKPLSGTKGDANNPDKPKDFCSLHPEMNACKNASVAGSCGALQCTGDAIQCASLVEQQRMYCESLTSSTLVDLGKSMLAGNEVPLAGSASAPNVVDLGGMTRLDASPFLGGGACFPDQVFPFYGRTVAIPWSRACEPLAGLRMVVMFLAYFSAYKMLSGVVIRET